MARFEVVPLFVLFVAYRCFPQVPVSDPQAVSYAQQSIAAMTSGTAVADVTLTGTLTAFSESGSQVGSAILYAKGAGESRIDLTLGEASFSDIRNDTDFPQGATS